MRVSDCMNTFLKKMDKGSEEFAGIANNLAWRWYCKKTQLEEAEGLATQSLEVEWSLATLQTLLAVQGRLGKWDLLDVNLRRFIRNSAGSRLAEKWAEDIMFFRDAVGAGRGSWVAARIDSELPSPRSEEWEVLRLALSDKIGEEQQLRAAADVVRGQLQSSEDNPKFPTSGC